MLGLVILALTAGKGDLSSVKATFGGGLPLMFTPEVRFWESDIIRWSGQYGVSPLLVATVMQIESCGDPYAISSAGATGLFQVMPFHFSDGENPFDVNTNAKAGLTFLAERQAATKGADVMLTMAQYNGGQATLNRPPSTWAAETRRYVEYGVEIYTDSTQGKASSDKLNQWHSLYGKGLCADAAANQSEVRVIRSTGANIALAELLGMVATAADSVAGAAATIVSPYLYGLDLPGKLGGRPAVTIPGCVVEPARNHNPRWMPRSPYLVPAVHTREGAANGGLHGCFVGGGRSHWVGVDIAAGKGEVIVSPLNGLVTNIYTDNINNPIVVIDNPEFMAVLLHGDYSDAVKGSQVTRGTTPIGKEASYGNSTGPHSHYQLYDKLANGWVDPFAFFSPGNP